MLTRLTTLGIVLAAAVPLTAVAAEPVNPPKPTDGLGYALRLNSELKAIGEITPVQFAGKYPAPTYFGKLTFDSTKAKFYDEFARDKAAPLPEGAVPGEWYDFRLNEAELAKFKSNGFVVSERMGAQSMAEMYYRIYRRDLPVFISADSILHAWHRTYDAMLEELELTYLTVALDEVLTGMAEQLPAARKEYGNGPLAESLVDSDYFIAVARSLLAGQEVATKFEQAERVQKTLEAIAKLQLQEFELFGRARNMDFSQFKPRGHYDASESLRRYFRAMMWCGRTDMRIAGGFDATGKLSAERELGSAFVLCDLLEKAKKTEAWRQFDALIQTFVGTTDSATFDDLRALMKKTGITTPADIKDFAALTRLQDEILKGKLGLQDIRGDVYVAFPGASERIPLPRSFTVLGQKFVMDSWVTSEVVFDSIEWQKERVIRRVPSGLDVAFAAFANNHAVPELFERMTKGTKEFRDVFRGQRLNYQHHLAAVRNIIDSQGKEVWQQSIYNAWLHLLRELSQPTTDAKYPEAMRTQAWAMKALNTQMASWTQLRHDTILYVKQSYTLGDSCYYPKGFVEPIPNFWQKFETMLNRSADQMEKTPFPMREIKQENKKSISLQAIQKQQVEFMRNFAKQLATLKAIAAKELEQKELSKEETKFLEDVVELYHVRVGSGRERAYKGWYVGLFYLGWQDAFKWDAIVADMHTDVPAPLHGDPGCVLHQGVGSVDLLLIAVDNGKDRTVYAGPLLSHYELEMPGVNRRNDKEWRNDLRAGRVPPRPGYASSYLVPGANPDVKKYVNAEDNR
jgi:Protein of unknown function (DUF3160)